MTDYKKVANILNDFWGLYSGKKLVSIEQLFKRYAGSKLLAALMGYLSSAMEVDVSKALPEMYDVFVTYRGMNLSSEDWETICNTYRELDEKYGENRWCKRVMLEFVVILEEDSRELKGKDDIGNREATGAADKKAA